MGDTKEAPVQKEKKSKTDSGGGFTMEEVAKHTTKEDCWVVLHNNVLNVTSFLSQHPGGELAILTFAGKDATAEFDMIHPPDVVGKYAPDAIIGDLKAVRALLHSPAPLPDQLLWHPDAGPLL